MKHPGVLVLVVIGVVFVGMVFSVIAFVLVAKPFQFDSPNTPSTVAQPQESGSEATPDHPLLTPAQEAMLQNLGVDVAALPTTISAEQMKCAVAALGETRVQELIAGAQITLMDMYKAKGCL